MSLGLLIFGIILAIVGYCIERYTSGLLSTLGKILLIVGVVLAIVGLILVLIGLAGLSLAILPMLV